MSNPTTTSPLTTPEGLVCERPPDATVPLAASYTIVKGRPTPTTEPAPVEVLSTERVVDTRLGDVRTALLQAGYRLPDTTMSLLCLIMQRGDMAEGKPPKAKPYNAKDLPAGGKALQDLIEEMPNIGELLGVAKAPLDKVMERIAFVSAMREAIAWCLPVIDTHEAHALSELADIVGPTVDGVQSLLPRFPRMERILEDALIYKKGPQELAQQTKEGRAKVAAEARSDERSKLVEAAPPAPATSSVVVAPVVVPPPAAPPTAPAPPASGPPKKR